MIRLFKNIFQANQERFTKSFHSTVERKSALFFEMLSNRFRQIEEDEL